MALCPVCQSDIEITSQHHGILFTCPDCMAVFFIDWNGQPEGAVEPEALQPIVGEEYSNQHSEPLNLEPETYEAPIAAEEVISSPDYDFSQPMSFEPHPSSQEATEPLAREPTEPLAIPGASQEENLFSDITQFGNADVTQAAFNYVVTISGIDTAAINKDLRDALDDSKFGWNLPQIMSQIKGGVLTLKSVNAVKVSILIQRVKYLPVKITWRQDVLSSHS
jgi:Zn-finger nucleic acid-binding protein